MRGKDFCSLNNISIPFFFCLKILRNKYWVTHDNELDPLIINVSCCHLKLSTATGKLALGICEQIRSKSLILICAST